jgi:hypothetical protein
MPKKKYEKLWIFGPSLALPWKIDNAELGWPTLVAKELGIDQVINHGTSSVDNFFIYQNFLKHQHEIRNNDLLIMGWSHPNRKMFVLDKNNPVHLEVLPHSLHYVQSDMEFIRSKNSVQDSQSKWSFMKPKDSGTKFYDNWFRNYFSEYEQRCNFQAYYDSVRSRSPCQCVSIFFSKESTDGVNIDATLFYLDFVIEHKANLSDNDFHLNVSGHALFSKALLPFIVN